MATSDQLAGLPAGDGEQWIPCADIRPGDTLPDIGTVTAVGEPGRDGEMRVRTADGDQTLMAGGIVRRRRRH